MIVEQIESFAGSTKFRKGMTQIAVDDETAFVEVRLEMIPLFESCLEPDFAKPAFRE